MNHETSLKRRELGTHYEQKAAQFLETKNYRILEKNVNYRWGEIDLVVIDQAKMELVFVEVRHRANQGMVSAVESVTPSKLRRLKRAIETFLISPQCLKLEPELTGIRIDLIAFEGEVMTHWQNFY